MSVKSDGLFSYHDKEGQYSGSEALKASNNYVLSVVYNKNSTSTSDNTNDGVAFFQNGDAKGKLDTTSEPNIGADGELFVGQDGAGSSYYKGYIGELIVYDRALKKEERQSVESYLGRKWGIKMVTASY